MSNRTFVTYWIVTILLSVGCSWILYYLSGYDAAISLVSTMSIACFSFLSVAIFVLGKSILRVSNKHLYLGVVLGNMGFKMVLSIVMMLIIRSEIGYVSKYTFFSFLVVYVFFTVFETYFMIKQSDLGK